MKNGVLIPGADSATLTLESVTMADAGIYSVTISNPRGTKASEEADLSIRQASTNLALSGTVTASAFWENNPIVRPALVIDGSTYDSPTGGSYWILPNLSKGWWQVNLGQEFTLGTIDIYNTNNGGGLMTLWQGRPNGRAWPRGKRPPELNPGQPSRLP
jgi:hypothetical protein